MPFSALSCKIGAVKWLLNPVSLSLALVYLAVRASAISMGLWPRSHALATALRIRYLLLCKIYDLA